MYTIKIELRRKYTREKEIAIVLFAIQILPEEMSTFDAIKKYLTNKRPSRLTDVCTQIHQFRRFICVVLAWNLSFSSARKRGRNDPMLSIICCTRICTMNKAKQTEKCSPIFYFSLHLMDHMKRDSKPSQSGNGGKNTHTHTLIWWDNHSNHIYQSWSEYGEWQVYALSAPHAVNEVYAHRTPTLHSHFVRYVVWEWCLCIHHMMRWYFLPLSILCWHKASV